jgi:glycosyltransferase involved in cell wall biosynthesis
MNEPRASSPLVSVIVPVHNVERYIEKCIDSICNQTHRDIEIIVVDDGSPDNSGALVDALSKKDPRIEVFHTINKGVSSARNLGMERATGSFISFVDGDDYLAPDFIEYMVDIANKTGAYFVMSRNCYKSADERQVDEEKIEIYTPEKAASELLYPYIDIGCWNKLFLRGFLLEKNIRFPTNFYMGEGLNFIVRAAQLSNYVGVGNKRVYHYRKDNLNSVTTKVNIEKFVNALAAIDNIENNTIVKSREFSTALAFHRYLTIFYAFDTVIRTGQQKRYQIEHSQWRHAIRKGSIIVMRARVKPSLKLKLLFYSVSPNFWLTVRSIVARMKRRLLPAPHC